MTHSNGALTSSTNCAPGQAGPVLLLTNLSDTVNKTDGVWLLNMRDEGATVSMDGVALGPNNVANLMTNLRHSGYLQER